MSFDYSGYVMQLKLERIDLRVPHYKQRQHNLPLQILVTCSSGAVVAGIQHLRRHLESLI